ncbi:hypothetical protein Dimus_018283 [Dionaea muscipula]
MVDVGLWWKAGSGVSIMPATDMVVLLMWSVRRVLVNRGMSGQVLLGARLAGTREDLTPLLGPIVDPIDGGGDSEHERERDGVRLVTAALKNDRGNMILAGDRGIEPNESLIRLLVFDFIVADWVARWAAEVVVVVVSTGDDVDEASSEFHFGLAANSIKHDDDSSEEHVEGSVQLNAHEFDRR